MNRIRASLLGLFLCAGLALTGASCTANNQPAQRVELTMWGPLEGTDVYGPLIRRYEQQNPGVTIEYKRISLATYESEVVNALASGRGPDIWMVHNTALIKELDKLAPAPATVITATDVRNEFVDVVAEDFVLESSTGTGTVYGLPLYVDTLALYTNRNLLQSAGLTQPPRTWQQIVEYNRVLTQKNDLGRITRPGISLGTASNIEAFDDIVSLLMLQSGASMVDTRSQQALFAEPIERNNTRLNPGLEALVFYTNFANPSSTVFSWTDAQPLNITAFINGELPMMLHYQYATPNIQVQAPRLDFDVTAAPQLGQSGAAITHADYWGHVVSATSPQKDAAWRFLRSLTRTTLATEYSNATNRPPARRDLIEQDIAGQDSTREMFARQALVAESWFEYDNNLTETVFSDMVNSVLIGTDPEDALQAAASRITTALRQQFR